MINEVLVVQGLLGDEPVNKKCLYGCCYLLAKYWIQEGLTPLQVRKNIFEWATGRHIYLDGTHLNVNQLIYKAERDKRRLREDVTVRISERDIQEITSRFDNDRIRRTALAILCYAKVTADKDNCFDMSIEMLCHWLGYSRTRVYESYLRELQVFDYIDRTEYKKENKTFSWNGNVKSKSANFKLLVPFNNNGSHLLIDNDIDSLFNECFKDTKEKTR